MAKSNKHLVSWDEDEIKKKLDAMAKKQHRIAIGWLLAAIACILFIGLIFYVYI